MTLSIRIEGLDRVQRMLGTDFAPAMQAATKAIALQVQNEIAPYPSATIANSPSNPSGRWYERGYGPKWRTKKGETHGRRTSQTMNRRWGIKRSGPIGHVLGNAADYSGYLHSRRLQARWAARRGWTTDEEAIRQVVRSGAVKRIVGQAILGALRRR